MPSGVFAMHDLKLGRLRILGDVQIPGLRTDVANQRTEHLRRDLLDLCSLSRLPFVVAAWTLILGFAKAQGLREFSQGRPFELARYDEEGKEIERMKLEDPVMSSHLRDADPANEGRGNKGQSQSLIRLAPQSLKWSSNRERPLTISWESMPTVFRADFSFCTQSTFGCGRFEVFASGLWEDALNADPNTLGRSSVEHSKEAPDSGEATIWADRKRDQGVKICSALSNAVGTYPDDWALILVATTIFRFLNG